MHPNDIDWHSDLLNLKLRQIADNGIATITTNDQIGAHFQVPQWRLCAHSCDPISVAQKVDNSGLHPQFEGRELLRLRRQKIKKMPLRHEPHEFALGRQAGEIGHAHDMTIEDIFHSRQLLMRDLKELIQQPEFMHQFESGWMDGVAAKVAKKIRVFLKNDDP